MANSSKIPFQGALRGNGLGAVSMPADRPLRLIVWPAVSALIGLVCAVQSSLLLRYIIQESPHSAQVSPAISTALAVNVAAVAAIALVAQRGSLSRAMVTYAISFIVHFTWFAFAVSLKRGVEWSFVPATYLGTIACSVAIGRLRRVAQPKRIGVVSAGLVPELSRHLGPEIELVPDPTASASRYGVLLVDFSVPLSPEWMSFISSASLSNCELRHLRSYMVERTGSLLPEDVQVDAVNLHLKQSRFYGCMKRGMDLVASFLMAPIALALAGAAAIAIAITMGRPIIFTQERVGRNGRIFRMYKLRTMSAHSSNGKQTATAKSDCRVTPLGRVLRRYRIDELPQLLNIVKGDMSLIGPRPEQPQLVAEYRRLLPYYELRHAVQPGLSGWAQVSYGYASTVEETRTKLTYDLFYIREFGLALDLEIAVATVWTLLTGRNAR